MAGLEAVAGVIGIASAGANFAKTLYATVWDIANAHREMGGVASRVREIATVLERLGESFEVDGGCCSRHMIDDVKLIINSCTSTFEELEKAIECRRSGHLQRRTQGPTLDWDASMVSYACVTW